MEIKHSRRSLLGLPILISLFLVGCSFIGPSRSVEIVSPAGQVDNINLTPRKILMLSTTSETVIEIQPTNVSPKGFLKFIYCLMIILGLLTFIFGGFILVIFGGEHLTCVMSVNTYDNKRK